MNIEQIRAAAESELTFLNDRSCAKIYVGSSADDSGAAGLCCMLEAATVKGGVRAKVIRTGSLGCYDLEPIVVIDRPERHAILYNNVTADVAGELIRDFFENRALQNGKALCCIGDKRVDAVPHISGLPLFNLQRRIALRNCGWVDPEDIRHYLLRGQGYTGLWRALQMDRRELLETRIKPALKGRSTAGDSSTDRWRLVQESSEAGKYLICKAIDSDPRARTAQLLLESDPHSILEGMLVGACAIGASHCLIYVRENTDSARRLRNALEQMKMCSLMGEHVLDSQFNAEMEIKEVPVWCIPGYETELFRCVEDKQPLPHVHPTYPAVEQFAGKPAVLTNPEAMSVLSAFLSSDLKEDEGSKVVTLAGDVVHKYTVEVPCEMPIRVMVGSLGGGITEGKNIKAIKVGGPAGWFIAPDSFEANCGRGSADTLDFGAIEVFDTDLRIVEAVRDIMSIIQVQSCGKCVFCREGSLQMLTILDDLCENRGKPEDLDLLTELGKDMKTACLCEFGRAAPDAVLSSIVLFRAEYEERFEGLSFPLNTLKGNQKPETGNP